MENNNIYSLTSPDDMKRFVENEVPEYHKGLLLNVMDMNDMNIEQFEEMGRILVGDKTSDEYPTMRGAAKKEIKQPSKLPKKGLWHFIKLEMYRFFCTDDIQYEEERKKGASNFKIIVSAIAGFLGSAFGVGTGLITGAVTFALVTIFKIYKEGVCSFLGQHFTVSVEIIKEEYSQENL